MHQFTKGQKEEVLNLMKETHDTKLYKKLEVLRLRMEGYSNPEIAKITQYSSSRVSALTCIYASEGITYFEKEHRVGGNRRNLSFEEETALLEQFREAAEAGKLVVVNEIKAAYDEKCGRRTGGITIYRMLERHGWRKVMPRSRHPKKASDEAIEASKKLTDATKN
jgi:transposase